MNRYNRKEKKNKEMKGKGVDDFIVFTKNKRQGKKMGISSVLRVRQPYFVNLHVEKGKEVFFLFFLIVYVLL